MKKIKLPKNKIKIQIINKSKSI